MSRAGRSVCVALLLIALAASRDSVAQTADRRPEFVGIRVGLDHQYKVGHWTPIRVRIRGGSEPLTGLLEITLADGDGEPSRYVAERPSQLLPGQVTSHLLYAKPGRMYGSIAAEFREGASGRVVARRTFETGSEATDDRFLPALLSTDELFVTLGNPVGLAGASRLLARIDEQINVVVLDDVDGLPTRWYGYGGVDALVIATSRPEIFRPLTSDSVQLAALEKWVQLGGRLVLCAGSEAPEVLAPASPLARLAPGRFERMVPLRSMSALESYAETTLPIVGAADRGAGQAAARLDVPLLVDVRGRVEARDGELPLVVRRPFGFGEVVFVAADLDRPPLSTWQGRPQFLARLLGYPTTRARAAEPSDAQAMLASLAGYEDLVGQLQSAIDQFEGVRVAPFWLVALLAVGYILLIGPADYLLVNRYFRRSTLTWITFPAVVVLVSVGAYALAYWMKGDQLRLKQVDLIDVSLEDHLVRGTSWINVFSPRMTRYDVGLSPSLPFGDADDRSEQLVSWLGVPGAGLGGMHSGAADPPIRRRSYEVAPRLDELIDVPIQVWSTKGFQTRWDAQDQRVAAALDIELAEVDGGLLEGFLTSRLEFPLEDCLLAYGRWAYRLDTLEPGERVEVSPLRDPRTLVTELTGRGGPRDVSLHAAMHRDVPRILELMMFYNAADGIEYAQLLHRYQGFLDLSSQLQLGRAILVGRAPRGPDWLLDGRPSAAADGEQWTYYRFLIPIEGEESAP